MLKSLFKKDWILCICAMFGAANFTIVLWGWNPVKFWAGFAEPYVQYWVNTYHQSMSNPMCQKALILSAIWFAPVVVGWVIFEALARTKIRKY